MRKIFTITLVFLFVFVLMSYNSTNNKDYTSCLERIDTSWGEATESCTYNKDIFKSKYKNICSDTLDVVVALQNTKKKWEATYFENVAPNKTISVFVCKGTGKSLKWVIKSGDTEITLPTIEEINTNY